MNWRSLHRFEERLEALARRLDDARPPVQVTINWEPSGLPPGRYDQPDGSILLVLCWPEQCVDEVAGDDGDA